MDKLTKLTNCRSRTELAKILGFPEKKFNHILFSKNTANNYSEFSIPKKSGGERRILAPNKELKQLQTALAALLSDCYDEIETERLLKIKHQPSIRSFSSHGFRRKLIVKNLHKALRFGIYSNAKNHTNKNYVLNLDLKNFFESITFSRIVGYFLKNENFRLNRPIAILIAQISTYRPSLDVEGYLPQGSPLSPIISNLIGSILDFKALSLAKKYKLDYSRYADDITFSTNSEKFPLNIAYQSNGEWIVGSKLKKIIERSNFDINHKKTRLYCKNNRQEVTSLTVNKKVNINKNYYRYTRSMVHQYCQTGEFYKSNEHQESEKYYQRLLNREKKNNTAQSLHGILSFVYEIKVRENDLNQGIVDEPLKFRNFEKLNSIEKLYTRFLFHYHFVHSERTVVIGEGITDQLHLRVAYKQLFGKKSKFIRSIKFTYLGKLKRLTNLMRFNGGTGLLKLFIEDYQSFYKSQVLGMNPCIILVDNDGAGNGVICEARKKFKDSFKYINIKNGVNIDFYHVYQNLYIAQLKKIKDIEELYPEKTLDEKVGNRTFDYIYIKRNPKKKFNEDFFYGKKTFYESVVQKKQESIDFTGFKPLFETFNYIQLYHLILYRMLPNNDKVASSLNTLG